MKQLMKTIGMVAIGVVVGCFVAKMSGIEKLDATVIICFGMLFSGVAYGWTFLNRHFGSFISGNLAITLCVFGIKLIAAVFIGWVILVIELIKSVIAIVNEHKGEQAV